MRWGWGYLRWTEYRVPGRESLQPRRGRRRAGRTAHTSTRQPLSLSRTAAPPPPLTSTPPTVTTRPGRGNTPENWAYIILHGMAGELHLTGEVGDGCGVGGAGLAQHRLAGRPPHQQRALHSIHTQPALHLVCSAVKFLPACMRNIVQDLAGETARHVDVRAGEEEPGQCPARSAPH